MIHGTLYKCKDCNEVFERPKEILGHGWIPSDYDSPNEYVCPYCESDYYVPADMCCGCGKIFAEEELEYGLCPDCLAEQAKEVASEYVMGDPDVRDGFAWWLQGRRNKEMRDAARAKD